MRCLPLLPPGCSLFNAWLDAEIEIGSAVIGCAVIGPWVGSSCVGVLLFNSLCSRACSLFNSSSSAWRFRVRSLNSVRASSSSAARCAIATCRLCASPTCTRRCASNVCSAREDASSSKFRATLKLTLAKNCACCNNASAVFSPPEGFPVRKWQIAAMRGRMDSRAELLDSLAELPVELEQLFGVGAFAGRSRTPARARTSKDGSGGATVLLPLTEGERARLAPPPTAVVRDSVANFRQSSALPTSAWYPPLSKRWPGGSPSPSRTSTSVAPASTEFKSSPPPSLLPTSNIPPPPPPPPLLLPSLRLLRLVKASSAACAVALPLLPREIRRRNTGFEPTVRSVSTTCASCKELPSAVEVASACERAILASSALAILTARGPTVFPPEMFPPKLARRSVSASQCNSTALNSSVGFSASGALSSAASACAIARDAIPGFVPGARCEPPGSRSLAGVLEGVSGALGPKSDSCASKADPKRSRAAAPLLPLESACATTG
mmetsp:Transcript_9004/g.21716  ORF Transcript_9004/g.21716 Transcript_9004/m.21716 type:complete len:495 (+) Transcript_9004:1456-2940(+)